MTGRVGLFALTLVFATSGSDWPQFLGPQRNGVSAERLVGLLAWSCGLIEKAEPVTPRDLLVGFDLKKMPREKWILTDEHLRWLLQKN